MALAIVFIIFFVLYLLFSPSNNIESKSQIIEKEKDKNEEVEKRLNYEENRISSQKHLFKSDWKKFQETLDEHQIIELYHFTDRANLASILKNDGLYSWDFCETNNINILKPNSNSTSRRNDKKIGLQNYVRLSFTRKNPMMFVAKKEGRIDDPVILEIDRILLYKKDTKFSRTNAYSSNEIDGSFECFRQIKFPIFNRRYSNLEIYEKKYYLAEALIFQKIPSRFIKNINDFLIIKPSHKS